MFERRIPLFSLAGFKVGLDMTWFILAVLITWSLAKGLFPRYFEGFSPTTYWFMGAAGAVGLFISIVFHEFCHSLVARRFGLPMKGITLFIFGGVAEMSEEPHSPKSEFFMAAAGPVASLVLAGLLFLLYAGATAAGWAASFNDVLLYLGWLNIILAGFNLIPAYPLDGGRILRSILWAARNNLRWATHIASGFGTVFGMLLIILGVVFFIGGNFIGGVWYFLIGLFIKSASQMSYRQLLVRRALSGEPIKQFIKNDPVTVSPDIPVDQLVKDYFYRYHYKMLPVTENGRLAGCVTTRSIRELTRDQWSSLRVADIMTPCSSENTIDPEMDAVQAIGVMKKTGNSRFMVVEAGHLIGVVTLKDMLDFLAMKIDLDD